MSISTKKAYISYIVLIIYVYTQNVGIDMHIIYSINALGAVWVKYCYIGGELHSSRIYRIGIMNNCAML